MTINIRAIQPGFIGEVTGIDICRPIPADAVAALERGMDAYAVLTFPNQPLTDDQQVVFSSNFGELEIPLAAQMAKPELRRFQRIVSSPPHQTPAHKCHIRPPIHRR